ncbi:MAG: hypothetical protein J0I06_11565 [Planctomycetes bacterium]|nr:hypothetical protein [Planctomycetota bacterium]
MRTFLTSVLATGLVAGTAIAGHAGPGGVRGHVRPTPVAPVRTPRVIPSGAPTPAGNAHGTHGQRHPVGHYTGRNHPRWTYWGYSQRYGCVCYWDPATGSYYYWDPATGNYYPVGAPGSAPAGAGPSPVADPNPVDAPAPVTDPDPAPDPAPGQTQPQPEALPLPLPRPGRPPSIPPLP